MITREELRRVLSESMGDAYGEFEEDLRGVDQRLASLKQDAQQPRLVMEADIKADKKTRKRTEGAATTADQTKHGDSCSAKRVQVGPKRPTSFDVKAEPLALPCRDDVLVENGAVSLTLGDAHTNSRRWLTSPRQNLYSEKHNPSPVSSLALPDRREKREAFSSIRLILQPFLVDKQPASPLLAEGH